MQTTSDLYKTILDGDHTVETRATVGGVVYGQDKLLSVSTSGSLYQTVGIGNAAARQVNLEIIPQGTIPKRAEIRLEVRLVSPSGETSEWIPKGTFFFSRRGTDHATGVMTVVGYDAMLKADQIWLDGSYDEESWPMPVADAVADITARMGVEMDERTELNADYPAQYPVDQSDNMTMRAVLRRIAVANAGNWCITDAGKLRLVPLVADVPTVELTSSMASTVYIGDSQPDWQYDEDRGTNLVEVKMGTVITIRASEPYVVSIDGAVVKSESAAGGGEYNIVATSNMDVAESWWFDTTDGVTSSWVSIAITTTAVESDVTLHSLDRSAASLEPGLETDPITGVALLDESGKVTGQAGDDTGRELEALEPNGTDAMATSILSAVSGYVYQPYEATDALLDPAAELGDLVSIDGIASVLARIDESYGQLWSADISAPTTDEIEDEYPYLTQSQRVQRAVSATRSLITKTAEEIGLRVEGLESDYTELKVTLDGVTVTDSSGTTRIKGSSIETGTLKVSAANITGQLTIGNLPDGVAMDGDIPTNADIVTIINGTVTASYIQAFGVAASVLEGDVISINGGTGSYYNGEELQGEYGTISANKDTAGKTALEINGPNGTRILSDGGSVYLRSAGNQILQLGGAYGTCMLSGGPLVLPTASYGTALPSTGVAGQVFFRLE